MTGWAANANQGAERRNILNIQETNYQAAPVYEIRTTLVARERTIFTNRQEINHHALDICEIRQTHQTRERSAKPENKRLDSCHKKPKTLLCFDCEIDSS